MQVGNYIHAQIFFLKSAQALRSGMIIINCGLMPAKTGGKMCSVGDSFGVELEGGIGTNLRCPKFQSQDNKCIE